MKQLIELYLLYVNGFITVKAFADYVNLSPEDAEIIINLGRKYHETNTNL